MKKGFTILELLVASLLLGMLMTILTAIFSQSSIAWRTGTAIVADMDEVRTKVAQLREEADNAYIWGTASRGSKNYKIHRLIGLWDENGDLRKRAWDVGDENKNENRARFLAENASGDISDKTEIKDFKSPASVGGNGGYGNLNTYKINVKSSGPNGKLGDYDDIWSDPDDFID